MNIDLNKNMNTSGDKYSDMSVYNKQDTGISLSSSFSDLNLGSETLSKTQDGYTDGYISTEGVGTVYKNRNKLSSDVESGTYTPGELIDTNQ